MKKIMILASFIPWLLYFFSLCKNTLKDVKANEINSEWIKNNFLKVFHLDNLILFAIFIIFTSIYHSSGKIFLTKILLFSSINLYLLANRYYDKNKYQYNIGNDDISTILILVIISLIPISIYNITGWYTVSYSIMFAFAFFNYFIVILAKKINDLLIKRTKRKNEK